MSWPTYFTHQMHQIHNDVHLQFEISIRMKFSDQGYDLLSRVMA